MLAILLAASITIFAFVVLLPVEVLLLELALELELCELLEDEPPELLLAAELELLCELLLLLPAELELLCEELLLWDELLDDELPGAELLCALLLWDPLEELAVLAELLEEPFPPPFGGGELDELEPSAPQAARPMHDSATTGHVDCRMFN